MFKFNAFVNELESKLDKKVDVITDSSLEHSTIKDFVKNEIVLYEQKK